MELFFPAGAELGIDPPEMYFISKQLPMTGCYHTAKWWCIMVAQERPPLVCVREFRISLCHSLQINRSGERESRLLARGQSLSL